MEEKSVVEYQARDGSKIKLTPAIIKKYLVRGYPDLVTDQELYFFMGICRSRGLNPFINDCYPIKFTKDPMAIVTSIDYYRKRARAQADCRGWKKGIVILGTDGRATYREGCILLDGETLIGGWAEAKPEKIDVPFRVEVNLKRYIKKTKDGDITRFWSEENQPEQIAKVAEGQCLRTAWPDEFQGLYVDAESQSRDAQDEMREAIATPSEPDPATPSFDEVFTDELRDPLFASYLTEAANLYKLTEDQVRNEFVKQGDQIKRLFVAWKKKADDFDMAYTMLMKGSPTPAEVATQSVTPQTTPTLQPPAPQSQVLTDIPEKIKTFRDEWINLKPAGYGKFVQAHLEKFKALSPIELGEAIAKWNKFYPGYPCPLSPQGTPKVDQQTIAEPHGQTQAQPEGGNDAFPERSELEALQAIIKGYERNNLAYVQQSKHELGMVLSATPQNLDGCRVLIEHIEQMLKDRPPKNGN